MAQIDEVSQEHRNTWRGFVKLVTVVVVAVVILMSVLAITLL
jgi:Bacterial aa3 type cytochrome c oxidase subunit IV